MANGTVDGQELAARTRGTTNDTRVDSDIQPYHGKRPNPATNTLGRWRCTWVWSAAREQAVLTTMTDTASAANLNGQVGP